MTVGDPACPPRAGEDDRRTGEQDMTRKISKAKLKAIIDEVDELDLPDGAYWAMIAERAGLEYGHPQDMVSADPEYYGWESMT